MARKNSDSFARIVIIRDRKCQVCGATDNLQAHHIIPVSVGGSGNPSNGIALCPRCHAEKHPDVPAGLFLNWASGKVISGKWNATSLAAELDCCTRTITRIANSLGIKRKGQRWAFSEDDKYQIQQHLGCIRKEIEIDKEIDHGTSHMEYIKTLLNLGLSRNRLTQEKYDHYMATLTPESALLDWQRQKPQREAEMRLARQLNPNYIRKLDGVPATP